MAKIGTHRKGEYKEGYLDHKIKVNDFIIYHHKGIEVFARCVKKEGGTWDFDFLCVVKGSLVEDRSGEESVIPVGGDVPESRYPFKNIVARAYVLEEVLYLNKGRTFSIVPSRARHSIIRKANQEEIKRYEPLAMLNNL
jgi:hypothetical protein